MLQSLALIGHRDLPLPPAASATLAPAAPGSLPCLPRTMHLRSLRGSVCDVIFVARGAGTQVRNVDAVQALVRACVQTPSNPLQERIINVLVTLLTTNANNYFIFQEHEVLVPLVEQLDTLPLPIVVRQVSSKVTQL